jgi:DNA-binding GntR family transcriptional regulator
VTGARSSARRAAPPGDAGSKAERAYHTLRDRIAAGVYGPGARLVLDRVARDLGVSVVPVREAVRRLEAEGYVVFRRNIGAEVASIDAARYGETMEALAVLEGAATALAAPFLGAAEVHEARRLNRELGRSLARFDPVRFTRLNHEFHRVLYRRCPNARLLEIVEREWQRLAAIRRSTFAFVPARARHSVAEHDHLLRLIDAGAPAGRIEACARQHRLATAEAFLRHAASSADAPAG